MQSRPISRFLFFSGKGGVGKTTMASSTAVYWASRGLKTLLVTTDPAANLSDVFEQSIGHAMVEITGCLNLTAMEIDPDKATDEYREKAMAPIRELFPPELIEVMEEQYRSPCTTEMAAFDRFIDLMDDQNFDLIIFDTAPTGHTLRLLELPVDWSRHIEESAKGSGQTCLGPVQNIIDSKAKYDRAVERLRSSQETTFIFVIQPEGTPVAETRRSMHELKEIGINSIQLIINGLLPPEECVHPFFLRRLKMQLHYNEEIHRQTGVDIKEMVLQANEVKGVLALAPTGQILWGTPVSWREKAIARLQGFAENAERQMVSEPLKKAEIAPLFKPQNDQQRLVFLSGKGGVGKTSMACAIAVGLAQEGYRTLLITTDPAAHTGWVLDTPVGDTEGPVPGVENLWALRIDPAEETRRYREKIIQELVDKGVGEDHMTAVKEELDSPCTEEMATFHAFVAQATRSDYQVLVFDTAPTGHTLRLLELPVDWSRQIELKTALNTVTEGDKEAQQLFNRLIERMKDPNQTTITFVVYPEYTPVEEARRAMEDLSSIGVKTQAVIANHVLPEEVSTGPFFKQRRTMQQKYLKVLKDMGIALFEVPLMEREIQGLEALTKIKTYLQ